MDWFYLCYSYMSSDRGFVNHCPYEIQVALFPRLELWFQNERSASKLWCDEENAILILEIFHQSCYLPMSYRDTIIRYVNLFHSTLFVSPLILSLSFSFSRSLIFSPHTFSL
jgi:hypothetical protein